MVRDTFCSAAAVAVLAGLALTSGCARRKAYDNPITKDTQQPDKVLFDRAVDDIEHGRYERGRLTLQTLMNTYDTSEYLAKAKLAYADSWFREGGAHGLAQAEAEYKDFILFYPQMEEAAEAQEKICAMQYEQMDKSDRDPLHARRAEDECRQLLVQFPNSKFAPQAKQYLLEVQEVLADSEFKVGMFYHDAKGSFPAAASRLQAVTDQYPLYSRSDEALMALADSYHRMGDNFENQEADAYSKLVKEYPLSKLVQEASKRLQAMGRPVPQADPVAYAREKYELENRRKRNILSTAWGPFGSHPNTLTAAQSGSPNMEDFKPMVPLSVPAAPPTEAAPPGTTGVSVAGDSGVTTTLVKDTSLIDSAPDARARAGAAGSGTAGAAAPQQTQGGTAGAAAAPGTAPAGSTAAPATPAPRPPTMLPQNHTGRGKALSPTQQLKLAEKQQARFKKMQAQQAKAKKKQDEDQTKKDRKKKKDSGQPVPVQAGAPALTPAAKPSQP